MEKIRDTIVLLGHTGSGKSELANTLADCPGLFLTSSNNDSCTSHTTYELCSWFGNGTELVIVDTPGYGDSSGRDDKHFLEMVKELKGNIKYLKAFVIVLNSEHPRLDSHLKEMLHYFQNTFKKQMWANTIVVYTRWVYGK